MIIDLIEETIWNLVLFQFHEDFALYLLIAGTIFSFVLSFAVGANDSANSWGTSVGSGTVSLGWAYALGSVMEIMGATLLSGDVIKKVVNEIINIDAYTSNRTEIIEGWSQDGNDDGLHGERLLILGCLAVMLGSGLWQLVASWFSWPVAGTHCIIFGLLGFTVTAKGSDGLKNPEAFTMIVVMLFVSIIVALLVTALLYYPLYRFCIRSGSPFSGKNRVVFSVLTGFSIGIPVCFILLQTNKAFQIFSGSIKEHETLIILGIGLGVSLVCSLLDYAVLLPYLKNSNGDFALTYDISNVCKRKQRGSEDLQLRQRMNNTGPEIVGNGEPAREEQKDEVVDSPEITRIFRPLQIISAMTSALVHGGNDVANCIGPFVVIYLVFKEGIITSTSATAPFMISLWGGLGISLGLILYGKKVIMTMGSGISTMTPSRGFCVEWAASLVGLVLTASGLLISTTHCKVGGLIGAGLMQGLVETGNVKEALSYVNFKVLSGVVLSWVLTIPMSFGLSSVIFLALKAILIDVSE